MAAGDTMRGRRLKAVESPSGGEMPPWEEMQPGDYCGPIVGYTGSSPAVFFLKPNARDKGAPSSARSVQHVCSPPHTFTEEPDGTLTIAPSISDRRRGGSTSDGWHGFLERGVWREV